MQKLIFISFIVFQLAFTTHAQTTTLVSIDANGKLTYKPDEVGSVIPDFSGVGYKNSEVAIPDVPVLITVTAVAGDNYTNVQTAINDLAAMPLQANGLRGAILFKAGLYGISKTITISSSGIVLLGEGLSTEFKATGTVQYNLIKISGGSKSVNTASKKLITDTFVPIGAKTITVESGHAFVKGDWVHVSRVPNDAWIKLLGADKLSDYGADIVNWTASQYIIDYERQILKVDGNQLTLDAPVMDIIDPVYATGTVQKITSTRIQNCGVENMKMTSAYKTTWPSSTANVLHDEQHGWNAIYLSAARDCWVKNVTAYYFGYSCVNIGDLASFITVDNCALYDPISELDGGRRYSFNIDGQRSLVKNCVTREGRHDCVNGAQVAGPNVFYNCTATNARSTTGPHHRWATGILYDNIVSGNEMNAEDRVQSGTGHGWAGAQIMFWNCKANKMVIQDPPSFHCNWAIGCIATITNVGFLSTHPYGIVESKGSRITAIPSLFVAQLNDRIANLNAANRYWVATTPSANWADPNSWSLTSGGAPGAPVPTTDDDVFFETGSATTVTLGAAVTVNSINFTSRNVTFAGAFGLVTNSMTTTSSQVVFVDNVTVNSAITFLGTNPRIIQNSSAWGKTFKLGNGGAFTLTGNSATNYFGGKTSAAHTGYSFDTTSALTVYFDQNTALILGGITVLKGLITLGNNVNMIRLFLNGATNNQELILAPNVTFTMTGGGSSGFAANGGVINASASGSKVIVLTSSPTFVGNQTTGVAVARIFKENSTINHLEYNNSAAVFYLPQAIRVRTLTKKAGTINNTTNSITIAAGGSVVEGAGSTTASVITETPVTRYWVGAATGDWFNAANWGTSSGSTSTPAIPEYGDNVVFDASTGNENPTVTLTDNVTAADITFTSSNVNFAGVFTTTTNSMSVNSSQVKFVDHCYVNTSLTFSGIAPRITQQSATSGKAFIMGNGGAFTLAGNSATNYFTGNSVAYYTYNTTSPLTVYFNPTTTTAGALVVKKGLITLGNSVSTNRITLNDVNSQELIVGTGATLGLVGAGTSSFTNAANGGVINASAAGSKVLITSTAPTILGVQSPGAAITGRIFKDGSTINHLEYNSASVFYLPYAMNVKNLTLTAGTINNSTNNITIPLGGNLDKADGTTTAALSASLPSAPSDVVATAGNAQALVAFTVPANGGSAILSYTVKASPGGRSVSGTASPIVITGLTNETAYTFTVTAQNGLGYGADSQASNQVIPRLSTAIQSVSQAYAPAFNLTNGIVTVRYQSDANSKATFKLLDLNGQEIMNKTIQSVSGTNTIMIAVGDLRAGIYIVSLSDGAKTLVDKLIKYN